MYQQPYNYQAAAMWPQQAAANQAYGGVQQPGAVTVQGATAVQSYGQPPTTMVAQPQQSVGNQMQYNQYGQPLPQAQQQQVPAAAGSYGYNQQPQQQAMYQQQTQQPVASAQMQQQQPNQWASQAQQMWNAPAAQQAASTASYNTPPTNWNQAGNQWSQTQQAQQQWPTPNAQQQPQSTQQNQAYQNSAQMQNQMYQNHQQQAQNQQYQTQVQPSQSQQQHQSQVQQQYPVQGQLHYQSQGGQMQQAQHAMMQHSQQHGMQHQPQGQHVKATQPPPPRHEPPRSQQPQPPQPPHPSNQAKSHHPQPPKDPPPPDNFKGQHNHQVRGQQPRMQQPPQPRMQQPTQPRMQQPPQMQQQPRMQQPRMPQNQPPRMPHNQQQRMQQPLNPQKGMPAAQQNNQNQQNFEQAQSDDTRQWVRNTDNTGKSVHTKDTVKPPLPADPPPPSSQQKTPTIPPLPGASAVPEIPKDDDKEESLDALNEQLQTLEAQIKTYQEEYQKWHQDFVKWQRQHQNHPDQRQYIDYQKKYQKMIEEQQGQLKAQYAELQKKITKRKVDQKASGAAKIAALNLAASSAASSAAKPPAPLPSEPPPPKASVAAFSMSDINNLKSIAAHAKQLQVLKDLGDSKKQELQGPKSANTSTVISSAPAVKKPPQTHQQLEQQPSLERPPPRQPLPHQPPLHSQRELPPHQPQQLPPHQPQPYQQQRHQAPEQVHRQPPLHQSQHQPPSRQPPPYQPPARHPPPHQPYTNARQYTQAPPPKVDPNAIMRRSTNEYGSAQCKFFPKCRHGNECKFEHPMCASRDRCVDSYCPYEHPMNRDMSGVKANAGSASAKATVPVLGRSGPPDRSYGGEAPFVVSSVVNSMGNNTNPMTRKDYPRPSSAVPLATQAPPSKSTLDASRKREFPLNEDNQLSKAPKHNDLGRPADIQSRIDEIYNKRKLNDTAALTEDEKYERRKLEILGGGGPNGVPSKDSGLPPGIVRHGPPPATVPLPSKTIPPAGKQPEQDERKADDAARPTVVDHSPPRVRLEEDRRLPPPVINELDRRPLDDVDRRPLPREEFERRPLHPDDRFLHERGLPLLHPDERGLPLRPDERGLPLRPDERGLPLRPDERGLPLRLDERGIPLRPDERGIPLRPDERGLPLRPDERGPPLRPDVRGPPLRPDERDPLYRPRSPLRDARPIDPYYDRLERERFPVDRHYDELYTTPLRVRDPYDRVVDQPVSIDYGHRPVADVRRVDPFLEPRERLDARYPPERFPDDRHRDVYDDRRLPLERPRDPYARIDDEPAHMLDRRAPPPLREDRFRDERLTDVYQRERDRADPYDRERELRYRDEGIRGERDVERSRYRDLERSRDEGRPRDEGRDRYHFVREDRRGAYDNRRSDAARIPEIELKPEVFSAADVFDKPGREKRPKNIAIILRGIPGAGKSFIAKLIKDKESYYGAQPPRILALDDYFMQEVDVKDEKAPNKSNTLKKQEYVYEKEVEEHYRASLLKAFNKTLNDGFFPMVIVDAINNKNTHFDQFWSDAKHKGFEVFIAELSGDIDSCLERSSHKRPKEEVVEMLRAWEKPPVYYKLLDISALLQDASINDVEMEETPADDATQVDDAVVKNNENDEDDEELPTSFHIPKSKWESSKEETLAKLDGFTKRKPKDQQKSASPIFPDDEEDDPYGEKEADMRLGKKRVRWADIEQKKQIDHQRKIGFTIGMDWNILTDPHAKIPR